MKYFKCIVGMLFGLMTTIPTATNAQRIQLDTIPDNQCIQVSNSARDSLARLHISTIANDTTKLSRYQQRAYGILSTLIKTRCVSVNATLVDTTTPTPPPNVIPIITYTLSGTTLYTRPTQPFYVFISTTFDSATFKSDSVLFNADTTFASIWWNRRDRRLEIFNAKKSGIMKISGMRSGIRRDTSVVVIVPPPPPVDTITPPPPPPVDTITPPPPPPVGNQVSINKTQRFQTMLGWRQGGFSYDVCGPYPLYKTELIRRIVRDHNITHRSIGIQSGMENVIDYHAQYIAGQIDMATYRTNWFWPVNDNSDPFVTDSSKFKFSKLDAQVQNEIIPWRNEVLAAGKRPITTLVMVDFKTANHGNMARPFDMLKQPDEYAEFITMMFIHLQKTYGWTPDVIELTLEPENSQTYGPDLARALIATKARLASRGFKPEFAASSNSTHNNVISYFTQMQATGATPDWLMWHRYIAPRPTDSLLIRIGALPVAKKAMTEYNETDSAADAANLMFDDIMKANVGSWHIFLGAACGNRTNPDNKGALLQVNVSDSLNPVINETWRGMMSRQVTEFVDAGAVRVGATAGDSLTKVIAFDQPRGFVVSIRRQIPGSVGITGLPVGSYDVHFVAAGSLTRQSSVQTSTGTMTVSLPADGILTLIQRGGTIPPPPPPSDSTPPAPAPPTPPNPLPPQHSLDLTPTPVDTVVGMKLPELPKLIASYPSNLDSLPCTKMVFTELELQQSINGSDKVICIPPSTRFVGNFDFPARLTTDTAWRVLRTNTTFNDSAVVSSEPMATLVAKSINLPVLHFKKQSKNWLIKGVEITTDSVGIQGTTHLVFVGEFISEKSISEVPQNISFSHIYAHGWLQQNVRRAFVLNGINHVIKNSRCTEIHERNSDSQCIVSWNGPGPFVIRNNILEAASEVIMFGGGDPGIPGLVPSDIVVDNNLVRKPLTWKSIGTPTQSGSYLIKLLYESKNARRALIQYNRFDGVWEDGQTGYAIALKSVNQDGRCTWCRVTDQTIRYNTFINVGAGLQLAGRPEAHPVDTAMSRVLFYGNWIDSLGLTPYNGDDRGVLILSEIQDLHIVKNTWTTNGKWKREAIILGLTNGVTGSAVTGFRFENNIMPIAQYGVGATAAGEGSRALTAAVSGVSIFRNNIFIGPPRANYPATTMWESTLASAFAKNNGAPIKPPR